MRYFILAVVFMFNMSVIFAQVGINTTNPTESLHVDGTFRLVDGTQSSNLVLTSDADGVARWDRVSLQIIEGTIGAGVNIPPSTTQFLQTGSSITLPPGRYLVDVYMLMSNGSSTSLTSYFWLRTTFSDSSAANPTISPDIIGGNLISAGLEGSSIFQPLIGKVIINNTSGADKTYYYVAGVTEVRSTPPTLTLFGGDAWDERSIIAIPIN